MISTPADPAAERRLLDYLRDRDRACPSCRAPLRGLTRASCPACGEELALAVGLVHRRMGCWLAGLLGLAAGVGFSAVLLAFFTMRFVQGRMTLRGDALRALISLSAGLLVGGALLAAWLYWGRSLRRAPLAWRVFLAFATWVFAMAVMVAFGLSVR
jgi:predicted transporter